MQRIMNRVYSFSEDMQLHYASPNKNIVADIMQLDAAQLSSLDTERVYQFIFVLGQYLVMLQYNENLKNIEYRLTSKTLEFKTNKIKLENKEVKGKTAKERDAWVMANVPEIEELTMEVLALEAEKTIIDGMVRAVEGLLNALKKEISGRFSE